MEQNIESASYWGQRYQEQNTPWDMGNASPPLTGFLQSLGNRQQKILIPGAGNAYEAEWLWKNAFRNVFVADIASEPLRNLQSRIPDFPVENLLHVDFFELDGSFDLILEQTFFCALPPSRRSEYIRKMASLLHDNAALVGVLFDFPLSEQGPPFGGNLDAYRRDFTPFFKIHKLERCYNSIKPRSGSELFIHLLKKPA